MKTAPAMTGHAAEHFFQGVCICPCQACTAHPTTSSIQCTCPACPEAPCGLKKESPGSPVSELERRAVAAKPGPP